MKLHWPGLITAALLVLPALGVRPVGAASEIVVAIRYLQVHGTSHAQLYLYRADGKLVRQLTKDYTGQMEHPVFSPDGKVIVFTRERAVGKDYWSVEPHGGNPQKLDAAPAWYEGTKNSPYFTNQETEPPAGEPTPPARNALVPSRADRFTTPDGTQEIILKTEEGDTGSHYLLRAVKSGRQVEMGKLPGFVNPLANPFELLRLNGNPSACFLIEPRLRLAFFGLHITSDVGGTTFALDLKRQRFVQLSPNDATPIRLPGESSFLTWTEVRYVPIAGTEKTANCSYIDRWDARLTKVRYARDVAAISYGASLYRPGKTPSTITIPHWALSY